MSRAIEFLPLQPGAHRHRKFLRLGKALGIHRLQAFGHLAAIWDYCGQSGNLDGCLGDAMPEEIEEIAMWTGKPGQFVRAATSLGLLDESPTGVRVHGFDEVMAPLQARRKKLDHERDRKRSFRASRGPSADSPGDSPGDKSRSSADVPDSQSVSQSGSQSERKKEDADARGKAANAYRRARRFAASAQGRGSPIGALDESTILAIDQAFESWGEFYRNPDHWDDRAEAFEAAWGLAELERENRAH